MKTTLELIVEGPPKEVIEDDPACEYFIVHQRLIAKGIEPDEVYPENWPDHNPWCCDHCGRLCFYQYETERYDNNLKKLKAEMKRLPLFLAGLENAQDKLELMRTIQRSKEDTIISSSNCPPDLPQNAVEARSTRRREGPVTTPLR
jgi:hypothetical protein